MIIFASTNDSVQFHEIILSTFLNRKFNMYSDDDDFEQTKGEFNYDDLDDEYGSDDEGIDRMKSRSNKRVEAGLLDVISKKKNTVCEIFALYGNMDQHKRAEILAKFIKAPSGVLISTVCRLLLIIYPSFKL
jgi:hypothetical protein